MKSSEPYKLALSKAKADPRVPAAIGSPVRQGWFVTGSINSTGPSGLADLAIPISGSLGKADIYVTATKAAGEWRLLTLVVEFRASGQRINLEDEVKPEQH
jgi:cytochrome oxidase complex assembly protein 1